MVRARLMPAVGAGFALIAQRPLSVLVWGVIYLVLSIAPFAALLGGGQDLVTAYREILDNPNSLQADSSPIVGMLRGVQGLQLLSALAVVAIVHTAIMRAVLRPEERSWSSVRLGMAELRIAGLAVVLYIFMILAVIALIIILAVPAIVLGAISGGQPPTVWIVLLAIAGMIALSPLASRMAMALPMTVAQERFRLFEAWTLTKGYGWKLAGIFLLILLIVVAIELGILVAGVAVFAAMTGGFDAAQVSSMFSPAGLAQAAPLLVALGLVYLALISAVLPITIAPLARAYQLIDEQAGTSASDLFE